MRTPAHTPAPNRRISVFTTPTIHNPPIENLNYAQPPTLSRASSICLNSPNSPYHGLIDLEQEFNMTHGMVYNQNVNLNSSSPVSRMYGDVIQDAYPATALHEVVDLDSDDSMDSVHKDDDDDFLPPVSDLIGKGRVGIAAPISYQNQQRQSVDIQSMNRIKNTNINRSTTNNNKNLLSTRTLPQQFHSFFSFPYFNSIQSASFNSAFTSTKNLVITSPTGSGKTVIMELAIIQLIHHATRTGAGVNGIRVVYISPTKSLCHERCVDWTRKFQRYGLTCHEVTGDTSYHTSRSIHTTHIVVTTPEKWDAVMRRWKEDQGTTRIGLVVLDEVHMLKDGERGATLEVVVSRLRTIYHEMVRSSRNRGKSNDRSEIRFLAVSATVPNVQDICEWLKHDDGSPAHLESFGDEHRPVKLYREVIGYPNPNKSSIFLFEKSLDYKLMEVIGRYGDGKPVLVFCSTRKSAVSAADYLACEAKSMGNNHPFVSVGGTNEIQEMRKKFMDSKLRELVVQGVAYHHGGMVYSDRQMVEKMYLDGSIKVICTTSTLAVGVNLPAHLVVVKGTWQYVNGGFVDYSSLDVDQMVGRAGRPQFDDSGVAIILTTAEQREAMDAMVRGREVIESSLHLNLIEHLNAEVVLGTISNLHMAMEWLKSTFLFVRIQKNPSYYKMRGCSREIGRLSADRRLRAMFLSELERLREHGIVVCGSLEEILSQVVREDSVEECVDMSVSPTAYGRAMAKFYVKLETVIGFMQIKLGGMAEMVETLCKSREFDSIRFRSDKALLNKMNKDIKYKIRGRIVQVWMKASVLLQGLLGGLEVGGEGVFIMTQSQRVMACAVEILRERRDLRLLSKAVELLQAVTAGTWAEFPLRQLDGIGARMSHALNSAKVSSIADLLKKDSREIERILGRNPPFGNKIIQSALSIPHPTIRVCHVTPYPPSSATNLSVSLSLSNPQSANQSKKRNLSFFFLAGIPQSNHVIHFTKFNIKQLISTINFPIQVNLEPGQSVKICLFSHDFVGRDVEHEFIPNQATNVAKESNVDLPQESNPAQPQPSIQPFKKSISKYFPNPSAITTLESPPEQSIQPQTTSTSPSATNFANPPCNHKCKNKSTCSHSCCKTGLTSTRRKRKNNQQQHPSSKRIHQQTHPFTQQQIHSEMDLMPDDNLLASYDDPRIHFNPLEFADQPAANPLADPLDSYFDLDDMDDLLVLDAFDDVDAIQQEPSREPLHEELPQQTSKELHEETNQNDPLLLVNNSFRNLFDNFF